MPNKDEIRVYAVVARSVSSVRRILVNRLYQKIGIVAGDLLPFASLDSFGFMARIKLHDDIITRRD